MSDSTSGGGGSSAPTPITSGGSSSPAPAPTGGTASPPAPAAVDPTPVYPMRMIDVPDAAPIELRADLAVPPGCTIQGS